MKTAAIANYNKNKSVCMLTRLTFKATKFNVVRYAFFAGKDATDADRKKVADTFGNIGTTTN